MDGNAFQYQPAALIKWKEQELCKVGFNKRYTAAVSVYDTALILFSKVIKKAYGFRIIIKAHDVFQ